MSHLLGHHSKGRIHTYSIIHRAERLRERERESGPLEGRGGLVRWRGVRVCPEYISLFHQPAARWEKGKGQGHAQGHHQGPFNSAERCCSPRVYSREKGGVIIHEGLPGLPLGLMLASSVRLSRLKNELMCMSFVAQLTVGRRTDIQFGAGLGDYCSYMSDSSIYIINRRNEQTRWSSSERLFAPVYIIINNCERR